MSLRFMIATPPLSVNQKRKTSSGGEMLHCHTKILAPQHCRSRTCGCWSAAPRLPQPLQPATDPLGRKRVCRVVDRRELMSPDYDTGFCPRHCCNTDCLCTRSGPPGLKPRVLLARRCKRAGDQGCWCCVCCPEHCTSRRRCGRLAPKTRSTPIVTLCACAVAVILAKCAVAPLKMLADCRLTSATLWHLRAQVARRTWPDARGKRGMLILGLFTKHVLHLELRCRLTSRLFVTGRKA